jgi:hypothetical protein
LVGTSVPVPPPTLELLDLSNSLDPKKKSSEHTNKINEVISELAHNKRVNDDKVYMTTPHSDQDLLLDLFSTTDPTLLLPITSLVNAKTNTISPLAKGKIMNTFAQTNFDQEKSRCGEGITNIFFFFFYYFCKEFQFITFQSLSRLTVSSNEKKNELQKKKKSKRRKRKRKRDLIM